MTTLVFIVYYGADNRTDAVRADPPTERQVSISTDRMVLSDTRLLIMNRIATKRISKLYVTPDRISIFVLG